MFRTWVIRGQHGDERLGEDTGDIQAISGIAVPQNAGVQRAISQTLDHASSERLVQMQAHTRIGCVVSAKDAGQSCQHARSDKANVERAHFSTAHAARLLNIALDVTQSATSAL
jgi:hypothetical protein